MTGYIHTSGTLRVTSLSRPITGVDGVCQLFPDANCGLAGDGYFGLLIFIPGLMFSPIPLNFMIFSAVMPGNFFAML